MVKAGTILFALGVVVMLSCNAVEGGPYMHHGELSRKGLKEERKLVTTGGNPSLNSLSEQATGTVDAGSANNNAENTKTEAAGAGPAYTPMTATTTDSHHDISVDQYRRIIRNNQNKPSSSTTK
ncbi:hypothetical protein EJB05_47385, partial [Eragrostis curvula]